MKIAVVGAGAAGLSAIKQTIDAGHDCQAFEVTEHVGGTWNYTDEVGLNKYGLPVMTSMYKNLRTNLPKDVMCYEDFRYPLEIKKSYITQEEVLKYFNNYADLNNLRPYIKFLTLVTHVEPIEDGQWNVEVQDVITKQKNTQIFDAVIVCNGKYAVPKIPEIPGLEQFEGRFIHSHDYRSVDPYKNKVVLVVGAGPSGLDICGHLLPVAKEVIFSYSSCPYERALPPGMKRKPLIKRVLGDSVLFEDETEEKVDEIILCTGFLYNYPFLNEKCNIQVLDNYVRGLYKECICVASPTLLVVGIPGNNCPIPNSEHQIRFFLAFLAGRFSLPSKAAMIEEDDRKRKAKNCSSWLYHRHGIKGEREYWNDLAEMGNIRNVPNVIDRMHQWSFDTNKCIEKNIRRINDDEFEVLN